MVRMMYLQYFGLNTNPFSLTPDPRFLLLTSKHREALAALILAVTERKGFMVLSGEAGTGKTTLIRKLLSSIPTAKAQFSVIVNPTLTRAEFLESVLMGFGESNVFCSKAQQLFLLKSILLSAYRQGRTSTLVIDEAHLLTQELIEEVRLLSNFETSEQKLLQIILAGQKELDTLLTLEATRSLRQRVAITMHIDPLETSEVESYLRNRWERASATSALPFSEEAITVVANGSKGIPRLINVICDAALLNAYGSGMKEIGPAQVHEVLQDSGLSVIDPVWTEPSLTTSTPPNSVYQSSAQSVSSPDTTLGTLERYLPRDSKVAMKKKFANWFRTAQSEVK